jgi:hypothetical protein
VGEIARSAQSRRHRASAILPTLLRLTARYAPHARFAEQQRIR